MFNDKQYKFMKKRLLLSLTALVAFSATAQVKFDEKLKIGKPKSVKLKKEFAAQKTANVTSDNSYYYWENNSRYTSELNTYLNDTPPSQGGYGFDTLGLYSYTVKEKTTSATYWQMLFQGIPAQADLTLNSLRYLGNALNSAGSNVNVSVYNKDMSAVLGSKDVTFTPTYGWQEVIFDTPVSSNDTMLVILTMQTAGDSVAVAYSHNYFNGIDLLGSGTPYQTALPFTGDAAILAVEPNNANILGLIRDNFDFFIIPNFSYDVTADFAASTTTLCEGEDVTFTNSGDVSHISNPILNYFAWDSKANGTTLYYTRYDYEGNTTADYQDGQAGTYTYATGGSYSAVASVVSWPWSSPSMLQDDQNFTITVNSKTTPTFDAIADFCVGATAPALATTSNNSIVGTWSPATIDNTTAGTTTYVFTSDNGQCANNTSVDVTVLDCANINELNANSFVVYPNPANGLVNVSLNNLNGTISLLSTDGKVIESRVISSNTETFNVESLNAGIYFIQVGQSVQKLMVK